MKEVAYDEQLAARIRTLLADRSDVREVQMFGGLSFMVADQLAISADNLGGLLIRCHPDGVEQLRQLPGVTLAEMRGRRMSTGWLRVDRGAVEGGASLELLVKAAIRRSPGGGD